MSIVPTMHEHIRAVLEPWGFVYQKSDFPGLGAALVRPCNAEWCFSAWARGVALESVDVGLQPHNDKQNGIIGTVHRFATEQSIVRDLAAVLNELAALAAAPELMKCPECGWRWVQLKEGRNGPFLSCVGMVISGRGPNKAPTCRGTSSRIAALVPHS